MARPGRSYSPTAEEWGLITRRERNLHNEAESAVAHLNPVEFPPARIISWD